MLYDAFGQRCACRDTAKHPNPRFIRVGGLLYYNARMYDPLLARFISADSIIPALFNPQSLNRYTYVTNNPLRYIDPSGHCHFDAAGNIDKWDCTVEEFDAMSISDRIKWMEQFQRQSGCTDCFSNILGVLDFFDFGGLAASGSWLSMVDAGILQGISLGYGAYLHSTGRGLAMTNTNWGASAWADFFNEHGIARARGLLRDPVVESDLRKRWARAEQRSTEYAIWYAKHGTNPVTGTAYGLEPTIREFELLGATQFYRTVVSLGAGDVSGPNPFDPFSPNQRSVVFYMAGAFWLDSIRRCPIVCDVVTFPIP